MEFVHTTYGPGRIIQTDTIRGRTQYKVAGRGFEVWVDAKDVRPDTSLHYASPFYDGGGAHVNEKNHATLPYDPTPQFPVDQFRSESTISPDHEIDPDKRVRRPSNSLDFDKAEDYPYPGPSPDLFAKHGAYDHEYDGPAAHGHDNPYANHKPTNPDFGAGSYARPHHEHGVDEDGVPFGRPASYRPAGLSDKYIDVHEAAADRSDPVVRFRMNPDSEIMRHGYLLSCAHEPAGMESYGRLVEADKQLREAAWRDVRSKAKRLRSEGAVHVKDLDYDRIYASVQGDSGTYDVMIKKGGTYTGGQSISNWHCSCEWGRWAFKRRMTYVGRLCSHGYAAYLEMQSRAVKDNPDHPLSRGRVASAVEDYKKWAKDSGQGTDEASLSNYIALHDTEPLDSDEVQQLYDYVDEHPTRKDVRDFDTDYEFRTAAPLRTRPKSLVPDMVLPPEDADDEHGFVDVTKDDRETTGPDQIVHFSHRYADSNGVHQNPMSGDYFDADGNLVNPDGSKPQGSDWSGAGKSFGDAMSWFNNSQRPGQDAQSKTNPQPAPTAPAAGQPAAPAPAPKAAPSAPSGGREPGWGGAPGTPPPVPGPGSTPAVNANSPSTQPPAPGGASGAPKAPPAAPGTTTPPGANGAPPPPPAAGGTGGVPAGLHGTFGEDGKYNVGEGDTVSGINQALGGGNDFSKLVNQNNKGMSSGTDLSKDVNMIHPGDSFDVSGIGKADTNKGFGQAPAAPAAGAPEAPKAPTIPSQPNAGPGQPIQPKASLQRYADTDLLNKLRDLSAQPNEDHFGDMQDHNNAIRDVVDELHERGYDANRLVAFVRQGAGDFLTPGGGDWADMPFQGSGPNPRYWMSSSEDYVEKHEKPDWVDVTQDDGDIVKYTNPGKKGSRHIADQLVPDAASGSGVISDGGPDYSAGGDLGDASGGMGLTAARWIFSDDESDDGDDHGASDDESQAGKAADQIGGNAPAGWGTRPAEGDDMPWSVPGDVQGLAQGVGNMMPSMQGGGMGGGGLGDLLGGGGEAGAAEGGAAAGEAGGLAEALPLLAVANVNGIRGAGRSYIHPKPEPALVQAKKLTPPEDFGFDGPGDEAFNERMASALSSDDHSDVVAAFQKAGGIESINQAPTPAQNSGTMFADGDIAQAAQAMLRTAGRDYSLAQQRELETEEHHLGARNMPTPADLAGTHYLLP